MYPDRNKNMSTRRQNGTSSIATISPTRARWTAALLSTTALSVMMSLVTPAEADPATCIDNGVTVTCTGTLSDGLGYSKIEGYPGGGSNSVVGSGGSGNNGGTGHTIDVTLSNVTVTVVGSNGLYGQSGGALGGGGGDVTGVGGNAGNGGAGGAGGDTTVTNNGTINISDSGAGLFVNSFGGGGGNGGAVSAAGGDGGNGASGGAGGAATAINNGTITATDDYVVGRRKPRRRRWSGR